MKHIRVFGCSTQILIRKSQCGGKFAEVTQDGVLLGFVDDNCNYQVYNLDTDKVVISHNLFFNEGHFPFRLYPTQHLPDPEPFEQPDTASSLSPLPPAYSNKPVDDDKIPPPPLYLLVQHISCQYRLCHLNCRLTRLLTRSRLLYPRNHVDDLTKSGTLQ